MSAPTPPRTFDDLVARPARWLSGEGPHADLVLSSRIRLARNLRNVPFTHRARDEQLQGVLLSVAGAARDSSSRRRISSRTSAARSNSSRSTARWSSSWRRWIWRARVTPSPSPTGCLPLCRVAPWMRRSRGRSWNWKAV